MIIVSVTLSTLELWYEVQWVMNSTPQGSEVTASQAQLGHVTRDPLNTDLLLTSQADNAQGYFINRMMLRVDNAEARIGAIGEGEQQKYYEVFCDPHGKDLSAPGPP